MVWNELTKIALLGTAHSSFGNALLDLLGKQGVHINEDEGKVLLESIALFGQIRKAGFIPDSFKADIPVPEENKAEKPCSPRTSRHLDLILQGEYEAVLPELIDLLVHSNQVIAPENLPNLIDKCLEAPDLWDKLAPILGSTGWWLVRQNPAWRNLVKIPPISHWESKNLIQQLDYLFYIRSQDPERALDLIETKWNAAPRKYRLNYLKILASNLSIDDQPFLESCLFDSRKEIRQVAAALLAQIPDSDLVERMYIRATDRFRIKGHQLVMEFEEELDETALRDGLSSTPLAGFGQNSGLLFQLCQQIPPSRWESWANLSAPAVFKVFYTSSWSEPLIKGLIEATIRYEDDNWALLLLKNWLQSGNERAWDKIPVTTLAGLVNQQNFSQLALDHLQERKPRMPSENAPILRLLTVAELQWSDALGVSVIEALRTWITASDTSFWEQVPYQTLLSKAAYRCPAHLYNRFKSGWNTQIPDWGLWEKPVEKFLRTLTFRHAMIEEILSNP